MLLTLSRIALLLTVTIACRHTAPTDLQGSGGLLPEGNERFIAVPLVKYEKQFYGRDCPAGQAFFSYCGATRVTDDLAITSRHCVIKDGGPADVFWFEDEAAVHRVLYERKECLDIETTVARLIQEAGGKKLSKDGIFAPMLNGSYVTDPDFAMFLEPRLRQTRYSIHKLADPATVAPGSTVMRIAFGSVDCRTALPPELRSKYPGYEYAYDRHGVTRYGTSKAYAEFVDKQALAKYSKEFAAKRNFEDYIYYVSGKDGVYGCLGDSSSSLVMIEGEWRIIGVHKGGLPIYDESPGSPPKTPTPYKLEIGVKISAENVCTFARQIPEAAEVFAGVCR